jgi:predicted Ser/Thr protein kinase
MGVVYKARQKNLDRIVALKVLSPHLSEDPEFVERFTREAKALAQLSHPNIVGIHDSGIHDRVPYLVMEYIDGTPLRGVMAGGKFTPDRALEVIPQICDALQYAHANGIVHRDIKPENILIDRQGRVKIADFGLAKLSVEQSKLTQSGFVMGTPRYMAPEQFEPAGRVDHRADIYSLGVVFYEMLTGEVPMGRFKPPSAKADVDHRLDPVVLKSLEREPEDRYQSAGEVKDQVTDLKNRPKPERRKPIIVRTPSPIKRAAFVLANVGGVLVAASLILALLKLFAFAEVAGKIGVGLLVVAFVVWLVSVIVGLVKNVESPAAADPNVQLKRTQIGGCLLAMIIIAVFVLALVGLFMGGSAPPAPPAVTAPAVVDPLAQGDAMTMEAAPPRITSARLTWKENLPAGDRLGVIGGNHSFLAVSKEEIREFDPDTGRVVSVWKGAVDALPVLEEETMVAWGGGKITLFQTRPDRLTALHTLDVPLPGAVAGVAVIDTSVYVAMVAGGVFAVDNASGTVKWKRERLTLLPPLVGAPVVTNTNLIIFSSAGHELVNRFSGVSESNAAGPRGGSRMIQWDQGWATLTRTNDQLLLETWAKRGMKSRGTIYTNSTADAAQCFLRTVGDKLVLTAVNEIYGMRRNEPFTDRWRKDCPRTVGPAAAFGDDIVALPTVKGLYLYNAKSGQHTPLEIGAGMSAFSVACRNSEVLLLDPEKGRLLCYHLQ